MRAAARIYSSLDRKAYRVDDPTNPTIYRRGDVAAAEPAVPGWTMPVADLFA